MTSTDSESLLQALVPHYEGDDGILLPVARHGTGLLSLQTLVLLLEIGRARTKAGESFILALEEPELHVPPGLQRRLIGEAVRVSSQVVCTTHSPRVAASFDAQQIQILVRPDSALAEEGVAEEWLAARPLALSPMIDEPNALIQLYTDHRAQLVEALMFPVVLVPEGRIDFEWLRRLMDVAEAGPHPPESEEAPIPPFGSVIGVVPTRDSAVKVTFEKLRSLHPAVLVLVDGDAPGDVYVSSLAACVPPPLAILQLPVGWAIEDVVGWALAGGDEANLLTGISARLNREFGCVADLKTALMSSDGRSGGLKAHYMAHEEIAGAMKESNECIGRAALFLEAVNRVALGRIGGFAQLELDQSRSTPEVKVYRFMP